MRVPWSMCLMILRWTSHDHPSSSRDISWSWLRCICHDHDMYISLSWDVQPMITWSPLIIIVYKSHNDDRHLLITGCTPYDYWMYISWQWCHTSCMITSCTSRDKNWGVDLLVLRFASHDNGIYISILWDAAHDYHWIYILCSIFAHLIIFRCMFHAHVMHVYPIVVK